MDGGLIRYVSDIRAIRRHPSARGDQALLAVGRSRRPSRPSGLDLGERGLYRRNGKQQTQIQEQIGDLIRGHQRSVLHGGQGLVDHGQGFKDDLWRIGVGHKYDSIHSP